MPRLSDRDLEEAVTNRLRTALRRLNESAGRCHKRECIGSLPIGFRFALDLETEEFEPFVLVWSVGYVCMAVRVSDGVSFDFDCRRRVVPLVFDEIESKLTGSRDRLEPA